MTAFDPVAALALPADAHVDLRVPKKRLIENGAPTATDKRRIREGVEEIRWLAVLKPTTVGVAAHRAADREYLEIAVLKLALTSQTGGGRVIELVHRTVPYPVLLFVWDGVSVHLTLAHKRWSQSDPGKTVLDGAIIVGTLGTGGARDLPPAFLRAMSLRRQPRATLYALYQGWIDTVQALNVARVTGEFALPGSVAEAARRAAAIDEYRSIEAQIAQLRTRTRKETQIAKRVALNTQLSALRATQVALRGRLRTRQNNAFFDRGFLEEES